MYRAGVCYYCNYKHHVGCTRSKCKCKSCKNKDKRELLERKVIQCRRCHHPIKFHNLYVIDFKKYLECSLCLCRKRI